MKRKSKIDKGQFDDAVTDVFSNGPPCGDFGEIDALRRRRMINRILSASPPVVSKIEDRFSLQPQARFPKWVWIAAAVFVATIAAAVFVRMAIAPTTDGVAFAPGQTWFGEVWEAGENVIMDGRSVSNHARIPVDKSIFTNSDQAMLRLPTGIEWWLSAQSEGKVAAVAETQVEVTVEKGESWFRVDPERRDAPAFAVQTPLGRIYVTGTIFVVNVTTSEVAVTLLKGQVWIERESGPKALLKQGQMMRLGDGHLTALTGADIQRHQQHLVALNWRDEAVVEAQDTVGDAMTTAQLHSKSVESLKAYTSSKDVSRGNQINLQQIHRDIQSARTRGDWQRVAQLYRQIIQGAPGSDAAKISRVSLGEVYLTKLHRYNDALKQFNRYINSKHKALLQEALYGKCTSLKALNGAQKNSISERKCLQRFVQKFPAAFQTSDANARLRELEKQTGI